MFKTSLTLAAILTMAAHGDPAKVPAKKDAPIAKKEVEAVPAKKKEGAKKAPGKPKNSNNMSKTKSLNLDDNHKKGFNE